MGLLGGWHLARGDGDGVCLYFGRHKGARYVSVGLRGFSGWTSTPPWMPGGWEFYSPWLGIGRLYEDCSRSWHGRFIVPFGVVQAWRKRKRAYREAMREHPLPTVSAVGSDDTSRGQNDPTSDPTGTENTSADGRSA